MVNQDSPSWLHFSHPLPSLGSAACAETFILLLERGREKQWHIPSVLTDTANAVFLPITRSPNSFTPFGDKILVAQSGLTLCDPMDYTPPGSSVYEIFQARILEWVAIPFSRGTSQPRDQTWLSCIAGRFLHCWTRMLVETLSQGPYDSLKCQAFIWVDLCKENWGINPSLGSNDK